MIIYHNEEERLRQIIEKKYPNHPILKKIFSSTYKAVEEYWKVLREINSKGDKNNAQPRQQT